MRKLILSLIVLTLVGLASCTTPTGNTGVPSQILWPVVPGNYWVYNDSAFYNNGTTQAIDSDTATITSAVIQIAVNGYSLSFYGITEPDGWFGTGTYVSVDPSNTFLYEADSATASPYVIFATATEDNTLVGTGNGYDTTCLLTYDLYGFASTTVIHGFTCLKNVETTTNCNGVLDEETVLYVSPGIGVVRMEDWLLDSLGNALYRDYSQTLSTYSVQQ